MASGKVIHNFNKGRTLANVEDGRRRRHNVHPCRYGGFRYALAGSWLVIRIFSASQSNFSLVRIAMFPRSTTSARYAAWSTKFDPAGGPGG